jgi:quercetin dioxygenase-like cupin family protein
MNRNLAPVVIVSALLLCASSCFTAPAFAQQSGQPPVATKLTAAKFATLPNVPDCFTVAVEHGDPGKGPSSVLVRLEPGCDSRTHWHSADASVLVVGGPLEMEMQGEKTASTKRGDFFFLPAHHIHREICAGKAPCLFYAELYAPFDVHYVDASGKNVPEAEALRGAKKSVP